MSYFVDAYTTIAQWCSVVRRLDGFNRHVSEALDLKSDLMIDNASNIKVGIENVEDIIEDIQQALDASK